MRQTFPLLCSFVSLLIARTATATPPAAAEPTLPASFKKTFTGTIGKLPVVITLTREGRRLSGRYRHLPSWTTHYPPQAGIWLDGSLDDDGRFALKEGERDDEGNEWVPDKLVGSVRMGPAPERLLLLEGTRSRPNGRRALPLAARERQPTAAEARIAAVDRPEPQRLFRKAIVVTFPEVRDATGTDQAFNADVRRLVDDEVRHFKRATGIPTPHEAEGLDLRMTFDLRHADDRTISLRFYIIYYAGGAHGGTEVNGYVFDRATGKRMHLEDLFLPGSPYRKVLAAQFAGEQLTSKQRLSNWHLDEQGIWFAFYDGDNGDNACELVIPYTELRAVIDPAGPAGRFLVGPASGQ